MPILRVACALDESASAQATRMIKPTYELHTLIYTILDFCRASGVAKFPKMGDSLSTMPMNHRAKFDAASFIPAGEIRNRTNKQKTHKQ